MPKGSIESMSIEYTKYIQIPTNKNYNRKKKKTEMYRFYPFLSFFFDWMNFLLRVMASWSPSFSNNPKVAQLPPGVHPNTIFGWTTCISKTPRLRSFVEVVRSRVENDRGTAKGWNGSDTCTLSFNIPNQMYCTSLLLVYHYNHLAFFYASMYIYIYISLSNTYIQ